MSPSLRRGGGVGQFVSLLSSLWLLHGSQEPVLLRRLPRSLSATPVVVGCTILGIAPSFSRVLVREGDILVRDFPLR